MKTPGAGDELLLSFFCKDPGSGGSDDCAAFYRTDQGSWVVQGDRQGDHVAAQLIAFKPHETFLEIPDALADRFARMYVRERYGIDLGGATNGAAEQHPQHGQA